MSIPHDHHKRARATTALAAALTVFQQAVAVYALADTFESRQSTKFALQSARRLLDDAQDVWVNTR